MVQYFGFYSLEFYLVFKHLSRIQPHCLTLFLYKYILFSTLWIPAQSSIVKSVVLLKLDFCLQFSFIVAQPESKKLNDWCDSVWSGMWFVFYALLPHHLVVLLFYLGLHLKLLCSFFYYYFLFPLTWKVSQTYTKCMICVKLLMKKIKGQNSLKKNHEGHSGESS